MSLIDVGQSSKEFATEVEEEAINEKMKVLEVKKKAEESEDEDEEAFNELIKLEVKKMAEESVNPADIVKALYTRFRAEIHGEFDTGAQKEALREHFKECGSIKRIRVKGVAGRQPGIIFHNSNFKFRALISGFHDIDLKALTERFETTCGGIAGIRYQFRRTCVWIDFTCLESLNKALELDKITVDKQCIRVKNCISRWSWSHSGSVA